MEATTVTIHHPSARAALQRATEETHRALDEGLAADGLGRMDPYLRFLAMQAQVLPPLERALEAGGLERALPGWIATRRAGALAEDLRALGLGPLPEIDVPVPEGPAIWGMAYVLEGSRLGARVLERQADASDDPLIRDNHRFLSQRTSLAWPVFLQALEGALSGAAERRAAADAAVRTFALYHRAANAAPVLLGH